MTQDEIRERKWREAQETRDRLRPLIKSGPTGCREERPIPQQETLADSDTSHRRPGVGAIQATATGRLADAGFGLSALHRTKSISGECVPGVDGVSVMWSPLKPDDGPGRHSSEEETDNSTASLGASISRMCIDGATTTDDKQDGDVFRMQPVSIVQMGGAHTTYYA